MSDDFKIIASHRKATFLYEISERFEAGIVLQGSEVKSLREAKVSLSDAYAGFHREELYLFNCHINPYFNAAQFNHEPLRMRKLLMHQKELFKLHEKIETKGFTLIPTKLYFKKGKVKVELGLGKGKKMFDKRESTKKREQNREMDRAMKSKNKF
ncbi:MAG: SsrA-binding protein SmpB [Deltaproteobacteria bacterium]|nr:SsrA-binding protein SmpB [Deltaproteobacteria bacterium]